MSDKKHSPWAAIAHFFVHTAGGALIFLIIATPAIALNFLVKYLERIGVDSFITGTLTVLEYAIVVGDVFLYLALMAKSIWKAVKELEL